MARLFITALASLTLVTAQQIGKTPENHPRLTTQKCTTKGGCVTQYTSVVLDSNAHPLKDVAGGDSCVSATGALTCTTAKECSESCALEGANYAKNGVDTKGDSLTLHMYSGNGSDISDLSPRVYLLEDEGYDYELVKLLNQEFSFTVDVSNLPCGMNGALYLSEMDKAGGRSNLNPAGATYGTGYCDAQCGTQGPFINGVLNVNSYGACCMEMDIWEANNAATQLTPHPCNVSGLYECSGALCGSDGVCDKDGCGFNPYGVGVKDFYGTAVNSTVDTSKTFTVVTQFQTTDGTNKGALNQISRLFVQDGKVIQNAAFQLDGESVNSITPSYCTNYDSYDTVFNPLGGMPQMGAALDRGMVLIFSIWNTNSGNMSWLDSGNAGPCDSTQDSANELAATDPTTYVTFSNIKWGDIGSTY